MNSLPELILWFGVVFPLVFSPGPGNILCAVSGATNGFLKSVPFILGLDIIYTLYALIAGFGLAQILLNYPKVFFAVQLLGAAYIAWLGFKFFKRSTSTGPSYVPQLRFQDGLISQALNIKGITIVLTMYSQFLDDSQDMVFEVGSLVAALTILNLFTHFTWSFGGAWIASSLASSYAQTVQNKIYGFMLIGISIWLALSIELT